MTWFLAQDRKDNQLATFDTLEQARTWYENHAGYIRAPGYRLSDAVVIEMERRFAGIDIHIKLLRPMLWRIRIYKYLQFGEIGFHWLFWFLWISKIYDDFPVRHNPVVLCPENLTRDINP